MRIFKLAFTYRHQEEEARLAELFGENALEKAKNYLSTPDPNRNPEITYQNWINNKLDPKIFEEIVKGFYNPWGNRRASKVNKISQDNQKVVKWICPATGMYIKAVYFPNSNDVEQYTLNFSDDSFYGDYETWYDAEKDARKLNQKCKISKFGVRIS